MPTKLICHTPDCVSCGADGTCKLDVRSEEHTSELQSQR